MMKICFLYIDEPYNIYHSISIATQLCDYQNIEVHIYCTERNHQALLDILGQSTLEKLKIKIVRPFWHFTLPHYLEIKLQFRYFIYKRYAKLLSSFDGIVCSLYNDLLLQRFVNGDKTKLIFAGHGVANRSYSYSDKIKDFDLLLLAGRKEETIRTKLNQLAEVSYEVIGYVKHEICQSLDFTSPFNDSKPVVFYNPHWLKEYSSFYDHGISILDQFSKDKSCNLIFAPHSLLTTRNQSIKAQILRFEQFDNIHIDLGSNACHDMTYLKLADYYLGDVSSQALEFLLIEPRPCLFIDVNDISGEDYEFHSWELGDVTSNSDDIFKQLEQAAARHKEHYQSVQKSSTTDIFHQTDQQPSQIAADAIANYLSNT